MTATEVELFRQIMVYQRLYDDLAELLKNYGIIEDSVPMCYLFDMLEECSGDLNDLTLDIDDDTLVKLSNLTQEVDDDNE